MKFETAADFDAYLRDLIRDVIRQEVPRPRMAEVVAFDKPGRTCDVRYVDESTTHTVPMTCIYPTAVGQYVWIGGPPDDRHVIEVLGSASTSQT